MSQLAKVCSTCHEEKPMEDFNILKSAPDGRQYKCRVCCRKYREENRERILQQKRLCYEANKDSILAGQKSRYNSDSEYKTRVRQRNAEYQKSHKEELSKYSKDKYQINRAEISVYDKKRYRDNRQKILDRILFHEYGLTRSEFDSLLVLQGGCAICGAKEAGGKGSFHVDHDHITDNVRGLLCHRCNTGLGSLKDSLEILAKALVYISLPDTDIRFHKSFLEYHRDQFDFLLKSCNGNCQICGRDSSGTSQYSHLCVDHNHKTGMVRGLLCSSCNAGLGGLGESDTIIKRAMDYLRHPPCEQMVGSHVSSS